MSEYQFPSDDNGNVLRSMAQGGDNLNIPRDINFQTVTPSKAAADALAETIRSWGYICSVEFPGCVPTLPWEVHVVRHMLPTHKDITEFEAKLNVAAVTAGGRIDGWGCFRVKAN